MQEARICLTAIVTFWIALGAQAKENSEDMTGDGEVGAHITKGLERQFAAFVPQSTAGLEKGSIAWRKNELTTN
jgi:hypothetical protein